MTRPDEIAALADRLELHTKELANQPLCMTMSDWSQLSNDMLAAAQALRLTATLPGDAVRDLADFDTPEVQTVYKILCDTTETPNGEHWEGFAARRIVAALAPAENAGGGLTEVERLLRKISDLAYDEDACEPLDDAISYANKALAVLTGRPAEDDGSFDPPNPNDALTDQERDVIEQYLASRRTTPTPPRADVALLRHLSGCARAFLQHFNPCDLAEDKAQQWQALEHQCDLADAAIQSAAATPPRGNVEIGAVSGDGSPETIKFDGRWFDRRETVDALTSLLAEARAANWHGADGVLEVIAKRLEAWDTTDIWRSDAAGLVRSYKQSAAHGGGTDATWYRSGPVFGTYERITPSDPAQEPEAVALKPCPFCGGGAEFIECSETNNVGGLAVQCQNIRCEASSNVQFGEDRQRLLIERWNTRPVSLDRDAVKKALQNAYSKFLDANPSHTNHRMDYRDVTFDYWADAILALIEGRT